METLICCTQAIQVPPISVAEMASAFCSGANLAPSLQVLNLAEHDDDDDEDDYDYHYHYEPYHLYYFYILVMIIVM